MIDTLTEDVLSLAQIASELPRRGRGQKLSLATLYRWSTTGCKGIVLESIQVGRCRCSSREALQRFYEALTLERDRRRIENPPASKPVPTRTATQRRKAYEAAERKLDAMSV